MAKKGGKVNEKGRPMGSGMKATNKGTKPLHGYPVHKTAKTTC